MNEGLGDRNLASFRLVTRTDADFSSTLHPLDNAILSRFLIFSLYTVYELVSFRELSERVGCRCNEHHRVATSRSVALVVYEAPCFACTISSNIRLHISRSGIMEYGGLFNAPGLSKICRNHASHSFSLPARSPKNHLFIPFILVESAKQTAWDT